MTTLPASFCKVLILVLVLLAASLTSRAQTITTETNQAKAVAIAQRAYAALAGTAQIADMTLVGTATRTAGSDEETGNITLKAKGTSESRIDHAVPRGTRSEVRNSADGVPQGQWAGLDGAAHPMAYHNCQTDAVWFFPALSVLSQLSNSNLSVTYLGQETKSQSAVYHLQFILRHPSVAADIASLLDPLTETDVYVDVSSFLPVAIATNTHADNNQLANIPVEVDFSDYRVVQGVPVPFHIQKYLNRSLFLDVTVQSATLNSGLSDAEFSVQSF